MPNYLQQFPWGEVNNINTNFYLDLIYQFQFSNDNIFVWFILTVKLTALFPISFMLMLNQGRSDTTFVNADRVVTHRHWAPEETGREAPTENTHSQLMPSAATAPSESRGSAHTQTKQNSQAQRRVQSIKNVRAGGGRDHTKDKQKAKRHDGYTQKQQLSSKRNYRKKELREKKREK